MVPLIVDDLPYEQLPEQFRDVHVMRLGADELRSGAGEKVLSIVLNEVKVQLRDAQQPKEEKSKRKGAGIALIAVMTVIVAVSLAFLLPRLVPAL